MTLRRRTPLRATRRAQPEDFSAETRRRARERDRGCLGPRVGMPEPCLGEIQLDHIRASGALSVKSRNSLDNAASLCVSHHDRKGREGRTWRPRLIDLVNELMGSHESHVDPCGDPACPAAAR